MGWITFWLSNGCRVLMLILVSASAMATPNIYYLHNDHLGTAQKITDQSQQVVWAADYKPFGEVNITTEQIEYPLRFPGQYYDKETGTYYNYFRDYDPSLGRYVQSDPIGLRGGLNTYGYVLQNPINYTDPLGLVTRQEIQTAYSLLNGRYPGIFQESLPNIDYESGMSGLGSYNMLTDTYTINSDYFGCENEELAEYNYDLFFNNITHELLHDNDNFINQINTSLCRMGALCGGYHRDLDDFATSIERSLVNGYRRRLGL